MGANRTSFLANRRLQPLGHLSDSLRAIIPDCTLSGLLNRSKSRREAAILLYDGSISLPYSAPANG
jgi:hypothetical protein